MLKPTTIDDDELADMNDGSAAAASQSEECRVESNWLNALICEVQAWRRAFPHLGFMSGPNELELVDDPPLARSDI